MSVLVRGESSDMKENVQLNKYELVLAGEQACLSDRLEQFGRNYHQMTAVTSNSHGIRSTSQKKPGRLNHKTTEQ